APTGKVLSAGCGLLPLREVPCESEDEERHRGVVDRDVDEFAAARSVSRPERRQDGQRGVEAARQVGDGNTRDRRSAFIAISGDGQDARERLEIDVVARE